MANAIRFDHIKQRALDELVGRAGAHGVFTDSAFLALAAQCEPGENRPATKILDDWIQYASRIIDKWDVRMVGKLIECFPSCVPAHWKGRKLMADYNDRGDWVVFPVEGLNG